MRKNIAVVIILIMSLVLISCSSNKEPSTTENSGQLTDDSSQGQLPKGTEQPSSEKRLSEVFQKIMANGKYTMKYKTTLNVDGDSSEIETTLAVKDNMTAMIMDSDGNKSMIINKDNTLYMINHENKTMIVMPENTQQNEEETPASPDELSDYKLEYVGSGREDFLGDERQYEEYNFEGGRTKYYFDGDNLAGLAITIDEHTTTMKIEEMTETVDESLFEIPSGYQEIKL
ncbi:hypothetical protein [Dehalobacterium formicoaceticum]|uniref:hypothetical protein n=1 Tax=Dehalobacterium formicoaceticum TaxID=51515 RepID=UPI000B7CCD99|nr:hypothetical protein [Dehalobacterium formicoaceticum]